MPLAPGQLRDWLDEGYHGTMAWMEENAERRSSPRALWPEVGSIILLGLNYGPTVDPARNPVAAGPGHHLRLRPQSRLS